MAATTPSRYKHGGQPVVGGTIKYWNKNRFNFDPTDDSPYPDSAPADYTATTVVNGSWPAGDLPFGDYYVSREKAGLPRSWTSDLLRPSGLCAPDGTVSAPGWAFCKELDLGRYRVSKDVMADVAEGYELVRYDGSIIAAGVKSNAGIMVHAREPVVGPPGQYVPYPPFIVRGRDDGAGYYDLRVNYPDFNTLQWGLVRLYTYRQNPPAQSGQATSPGLQVLAGNILLDTGFIDSGVGAATGMGYVCIPSKNGAWLNQPGPPLNSANRAAVGWDRLNKQWMVADDGGWLGVRLSASGVPPMALDDLTDVATGGQADGDTIVRAGGIYVPVNFKLTKLKDVDTTPPTNDQVPAWDTTVTPNRFVFKPRSGGGSSTFAGLTDVDWPSFVNADFAQYDSGTGKIVGTSLGSIGGSLNLMGTLAARPAFGTAGRLYFQTDAPYVWLDTGSAWVIASVKGMPGILPPNAASWTTINFGTSTLSDAYGYLKLIPQMGTDEQRIAVRTAPSTPYTVTALFEFVGEHVNVYNAGFCIRDTTTVSGNNHLVVWHVGYGNAVNISLQNWTGEHNFSSTVATHPIGDFVGRHLWMQFSDNGTNFFFRWSPNGLDWFTWGSAGRTAWLTTPNQIGFSINNWAGSGQGQVNVLSWTGA
jgi:hypothetical protein